MCSVTFWPKPNGYLLGMNRDESRSRVAGLPPARWAVAGRNVLHPSEPSGGTWISVNDRGVTLALVNWYAITRRAPEPAVSRGSVMLAMRDSGSAREVDERIRLLVLDRVNPFRLIAIVPDLRSIREWRWDQVSLGELVHDWSPRQWLSSGHDEPTAQRVRDETFRRFREDADAGSVDWLRRLHASHEPGRGPFSTCMHREDAATVSYTEVEVGADEVHMRHAPCSLCEAGGVGEAALKRAGFL